MKRIGTFLFSKKAFVFLLIIGEGPLGFSRNTEKYGFSKSAFFNVKIILENDGDIRFFKNSVLNA